MNIDKILSWSEPRKVTGYDGKPVYVQNASPTSEFWNQWREHKDEMKKEGIRVKKTDDTDEWLVSRWTAVPESLKIDIDSIKITQSILDKLLDFQKEHTRFLINSILNNNAALDASDTGTGKTFTALAVSKSLKLQPLIIAPKATLPAWQKAAKKHFNINFLEILNYEAYKANKSKYFNKYGKSITWNVPDNTLIIFDEVQRCKDYKTQNAQMLVQAHEQKIRILCCSATIADNPMQMYAIGITLELFLNKSGFFKWIKEHGCYKGEWGGWEFTKNEKEVYKHLKNINNSLFPNRGHRIAIKDLGNAFPDNLIISECYNMDNADKIKKFYEEMSDQLGKLAKKSKEDSENHLTKIIRARQRIELLKVPTITEMAQDLIEEGNSVAIFVNFDDTILSLAKNLKTNCIIWGKNKANEREENRMAFQNGTERIIICNIKAGGVGISLHDEFGNYSRVSLISPSYSAQDLKQALGRIHRAGSHSKSIQKIVFCSGTIEEEIAEIVRQKLININIINDNDLSGIF